MGFSPPLLKLVYTRFQRGLPRRSEPHELNGGVGVNSPRFTPPSYPDVNQNLDSVSSLRISKSVNSLSVPAPFQVQDTSGYPSGLAPRPLALWSLDFPPTKVFAAEIETFYTSQFNPVIGRGARLNKPALFGPAPHNETSAKISAGDCSPTYKHLILYRKIRTFACYTYLVTKQFKQTLIVLFVITLLGAILRFYNLDWGQAYFFHPDERNIAIAVSNLDLPNLQLNPKFWAYGSFPIYLIYLTAWLGEIISKTNLTNFESYVLIGRILSALFSTLIIPLTFFITRQILSGSRLTQSSFAQGFHLRQGFGGQVGGLIRPTPSQTWSGLINKVALLTSLWVSFLPGLIQFAHFTTFEILLTLQYLLLLLFSFRVAAGGKTKDYLLSGLVLGLSIGTKITSLIMVPVLVAAHIINVYNQNPRKLKRFGLIKVINRKIIASSFVVTLCVIVSSPFHLLDFDGFLNSFNYESSVAGGSLPVFYTQQFQQTIPVFYQLTRVFPYILTIPLTLISITAFVQLSIQLITRLIRQYKSKKHLTLKQSNLLLILISIISYLSFHFSLYVKWTRYMLPILPFLAILSAIYVAQLGNFWRKIFIFVVSTWVIFTGVSFWQIYTRSDNRITAARWASQNLRQNSRFATEEYDLGILPFNDNFPYYNIKLLPIYNLETNSQQKQESVLKAWEQSNYFISLSQRLYGTRFRLPDLYPIGYSIYRKMFAQNENWSLIARFSNNDIDCSIWSLYCAAGYFPPDETFTVFDHPTVKIFKKY